VSFFVFGVGIEDPNIDRAGGLHGAIVGCVPFFVGENK